MNNLNLLNKKDLNSVKAKIIKKEVGIMKKGGDPERLKKAFDDLEGCIYFDGNGAELIRKIRKNGFINLKGA